MRRLGALLMVLLAAFLVSPAAVAAPAAETFHLKVDGVARWFGSTCADVVEPVAVVTECEDLFVLYFREAPAQDLREAPWVLLIQHGAATLYPDGTVDEHYDVVGEVENPEGSFDLKRFAFANVSATVPMSDGSELDVDLAWDMSSVALQHGGNDSLYNVEFGIDRHEADRCFTLNQLAHQQWRSGEPGQITGTVGDVDVQSIPHLANDPFTAGRSVFTVTATDHGGC
jgi:hypothetical protein